MKSQVNNSTNERRSNGFTLTVGSSFAKMATTMRMGTSVNVMTALLRSNHSAGFTVCAPRPAFVLQPSPHQPRLEEAKDDWSGAWPASSRTATYREATCLHV